MGFLHIFPELIANFFAALFTGQEVMAGRNLALLWLNKYKSPFWFRWV